MNITLVNFNFFSFFESITEHSANSMTLFSMLKRQKLMTEMILSFDVIEPAYLIETIMNNEPLLLPTSTQTTTIYRTIGGMTDIQNAS